LADCFIPGAGGDAVLSHLSRQFFRCLVARNGRPS
jgi:hypothetical protein